MAQPIKTLAVSTDSLSSSPETLWVPGEDTHLEVVLGYPPACVHKWTCIHTQPPPSHTWIINKIKLQYALCDYRVMNCRWLFSWQVSLPPMSLLKHKRVTCNSDITLFASFSSLPPKDVERKYPQEFENSLQALAECVRQWGIKSPGHQAERLPVEGSSEMTDLVKVLPFVIWKE